MLAQLNGSLSEFGRLMAGSGYEEVMWGYVFKEIFPYFMRSRFAERAYFKPKGYAGDFLMNSTGAVSGKSLSFALTRDDRDKNSYVFEIIDSSDSILVPSCSSYTHVASRGHQCIADIGIWPKILFLENEAHTSLGGTLVITRSQNSTNRLTVEYSAEAEILTARR